MELLPGNEAVSGSIQDSNDLQVIIDTIPEFIWCARPDGSLEFLNQRGLDYTGFSSEQIRGWNWKDTPLLHPDDIGSLFESWNAIIASREPGEMQARMRRFDGEYHWFLFRVAPLRDKSGAIRAWWGINVEMNKRKHAEDLLASKKGLLEMVANSNSLRAEEKILKNEREFRQIVEAIPELIVVLAADDVPLYANRLMLEYTGLSLEEIQSGALVERVIHRDDLEKVREKLHQALLNGVSFEIEYRALRKDGQYRWFLNLYIPLRDEREDIVRWYATGTDIHERKQTEERVKKENIALREEIDAASMFEEIIGSSPALRKVLSRVSKVAPMGSTVLITGETGTGKELIARAIHKRSHRSEQAFVAVNCAAIPSTLLASELFGHEKGAFTGALNRRLGRFELADGGTIFLDEIGELPMETQIAFLRVLQENEFERIGGNHTIRADVRVIAATNRDLRQAIEDGSFRSDLFYRLNVFPVEIPPLRERREDIHLLIEYFIDRYASKTGKKIRGIDKQSLALLQSYPWPGNIRELQNVIERSVILTETEILTVDESWLPHESIGTLPSSHHQLSSRLVVHEKKIIEAVLTETRGRVSGPSGAAVRLGIPASTLDSRIKALNINKNRFRP